MTRGMKQKALGPLENTLAMCNECEVVSMESVPRRSGLRPRKLDNKASTAKQEVKIVASSGNAKPVKKGRTTRNSNKEMFMSEGDVIKFNSSVVKKGRIVDKSAGGNKALKSCSSKENASGVVKGSKGEKKEVTRKGQKKRLSWAPQLEVTKIITDVIEEVVAQGKGVEISETEVVAASGVLSQRPLKSCLKKNKRNFEDLSVHGESIFISKPTPNASMQECSEDVVMPVQESAGKGNSHLDSAAELNQDHVAKDKKVANTKPNVVTRKRVKKACPPLHYFTSDDEDSVEESRSQEKLKTAVEPTLEQIFAKKQEIVQVKPKEQKKKPGNQQPNQKEEEEIIDPHVLKMKRLAESKKTANEAVMKECKKQAMAVVSGPFGKSYPVAVGRGVQQEQKNSFYKETIKTVLVNPFLEPELLNRYVWTRQTWDPNAGNKMLVRVPRKNVLTEAVIQEAFEEADELDHYLDVQRAEADKFAMPHPRKFKIAPKENLNKFKLRRKRRREDFSFYPKGVDAPFIPENEKLVEEMNAEHERLAKERLRQRTTEGWKQLIKERPDMTARLPREVVYNCPEFEEYEKKRLIRLEEQVILLST